MNKDEGFIKVFRDNNGMIRIVTYDGKHGSHTSVLDTEGALIVSEALKNAVLMNENDSNLQEEEKVVKIGLWGKLKAFVTNLFNRA
jgi:hypothetical protein